MKRIMAALIIVLIVITGMFLFRFTITPSLRASPTLDWDSRLDALNVTYQAATDCSQGCWRLVSAQYEDEQQSQGLHHIWARARNQSGTEIEGQTWYVAWQGDNQPLTTKSAGEWADYAMFNCYNPDHGPGGYRAWMGNNSAQSDQVVGMGLPLCHHVNFRLTWQWDEGGQTAPTSTPTAAQATSTPQVASTATPVGSVATATPIVFASPTSPALPLEWDSRFDALNVTYQPAANCSQGCWRLVSALYEDPNQSGGAHHIFARIRNESGSLLVDAPWHAAWPDGDIRIMTKAEPDWADYAIFACYNPDTETGGFRAYAGDIESQSDQIHGIGLPLCHHVNFRLIWQWDEGGENPALTPIPTNTATATSSPTITLTPSPTSSPTITLTPSPTSSPTITPTPDPNVVPRLWIPLIISDPFVAPTMTPTATPTVSAATSTPMPTTTPSTSGMMFGGQVMEDFSNCGLTQVFGTIQNASGQPLIGPRLRLTWNASNGTSYHTNAGLYVRPETDVSGWEFTLNSYPVENTWRVAVVDALDNLLSDEVEVQTDGHCNEGAANIIKMRFFIRGTSTATPTPVSSEATATPISAEATTTPTATAVNSSPTATITPLPTATPTGSSMAFTGEVEETWVNCGLTQIFGVVHNATGQPLPNTRLRLTWDAADAATFNATAGQYVRPETDESGWEFFLNSHPVENTWRIALVDDSGQLISDDVSVYTEGHCNANAINVVKVRFYMP